MWPLGKLKSSGVLAHGSSGRGRWKTSLSSPFMITLPMSAMARNSASRRRFTRRRATSAITNRGPTTSVEPRVVIAHMTASSCGEA